MCDHDDDDKCDYDDEDDGECEHVGLASAPPHLRSPLPPFPMHYLLHEHEKALGAVGGKDGAKIMEMECQRECRERG
eukprot:1160628-Pelagomonas_calceolata.AAC.9